MINIHNNIYVMGGGGNSVLLIGRQKKRNPKAALKNVFRLDALFAHFKLQLTLLHVELLADVHDELV